MSIYCIILSRYAARHQVNYGISTVKQSDANRLSVDPAVYS